MENNFVEKQKNEWNFYDGNLNFDVSKTRGILSPKVLESTEND